MHISTSMAEATHESSTRRVEYTIETQKLSYTVLPPMTHRFDWLRSKDRVCSRCILRNVDCQARPGQIMAIAGPSGAGKTTLLRVLAGTITCRSSGVSGQVLVNSQPMDATVFRPVSGYVTQDDDALFPLLTVEETLVYSARLRLREGHRKAAARVRVVLQELGLEHIAKHKIKSKGGISGGERRRVSVAVDLVHDPAVLLIDEPTSGLDSASALHLTQLLKSMATTQGKTIVLTVHQPGFRILELFDQLLLLANGSVLHHGSIHLLKQRLRLAGHPIPLHVNALEFSIEVMQYQLGLQVEDSEVKDNSNMTRDSEHRGRVVDHFRFRAYESYFPNPQIKEVLILVERFSQNIWRTKQLFRARMTQALLSGILLGSIFMNAAASESKLQTQVGFFAFSLTFLLSSSTEGLPIYLQERRIVMKESSSGAYRISSYVISNSLVLLPFLLVVALLYAIPVYWLVGLRRDIDGFLYFSLVVWMALIMSNSFVACLGAVVPNFITGTSLIAGLMGSFFLFSGYFIAKEDIPSYWTCMHYLSLFKYPFECLMINEYGGGTGKRKCLKMVGGECFLKGGGLLRLQGLQESQKWSNIGVMLSFIFGYRFLGLVMLMYYRSYKNKKY